MSALDSVIDVNSFGQWIGLATESSRTALHDHLERWTDDPKKLHHQSNKFQRFQASYQKDPTFYTECHQIFEEVSEIETKLRELTSIESKLERESYNEILFFTEWLKPLNFIPFALTLWSFIRVYLLPGMSLLIPILTLIAPYFILKFLFCVPIKFNNYMNILQSMMTGNLENITRHDEPFVTEDVSPFLFIKQCGLLGLTFVQGFLQPYWTHKHLKSIDDIIQENGALVYQFRTLYERLSDLLKKNGFTFFRCPMPSMTDYRDATAHVLLHPSYYIMALRYIGSLEVIMKLAHQSTIYPVQWVNRRSPLFCLTDSFDYQVSSQSRKTCSVRFDAKRHALLTGPNKGGKSTVLRALSVSAWLAHTYGCAIGQLTATPFSKGFVCLKPDDLPGSKSRFEREIEFTAQTLRTDRPILVFIDELYHSTNPPDALRSCEIYCGQLWKCPNVVSVISTHLFEMVENADPSIQRLCCSAHIDPSGQIHFEYDLTEGVCKVSSVDTLLQRNGLLCA